MSGASSAAASGAVFGIVVILLMQQFALISLSTLTWGIIYVAIGLIAGAVLGGLVGRRLTHRQ